jgi:hypothetical protein
MCDPQRRRRIAYAHSYAYSHGDADSDSNSNAYAHRDAISDADVHNWRRYAWSVDTGSACDSGSLRRLHGQQWQRCVGGRRLLLHV